MDNSLTNFIKDLIKEQDHGNNLLERIPYTQPSHENATHNKFGEKTIYCTNCGIEGHNLRHCKKPLISFGIILFRFNGDQIEYVMICRKESYAMTEFVREKYPIKDVHSLQELFDQMTNSEKELIRTKPIEYIDRYHCMIKSGDKSKHYKYYKLKNGIEINGEKCSLDSLLNNSSNKYEDPEWGFPKGRRNRNEGDLVCAMREVEEETNIKPNDYVILKQIPPLVENLCGENGVQYRYYYYVAMALTDISLEIKKTNYEQYYEISKIQWMTAETATKKIRPYYNNRKNIIKTLDDTLKLEFFGQLPS